MDSVRMHFLTILIVVKTMIKKLSQSQNISRRQFFTRVGYGLTGTSLLSISGCQSNTNYGALRIVDTSSSKTKNRPEFSPNLLLTFVIL
jgi:hypothetical protein